MVMERMNENKNMEPTTMTLSLSEAERRQVKAFAAKHGTTVSALFRLWIKEKCEKEGKEQTCENAT